MGRVFNAIFHFSLVLPSISQSMVRWRGSIPSSWFSDLIIVSLIVRFVSVDSSTALLMIEIHTQPNTIGVLIVGLFFVVYSRHG